MAKNLLQLHGAGPQEQDRIALGRVDAWSLLCFNKLTADSTAGWRPAPVRKAGLHAKEGWEFDSAGRRRAYDDAGLDVSCRSAAGGSRRMKRDDELGS